MSGEDADILGGNQGTLFGNPGKGFTKENSTTKRVLGCRSQERKLRVEAGERSRKDVAVGITTAPTTDAGNGAKPLHVTKAAWRRGDADRGSCLGWLEVHTAQTRPGNMHF